MIPYGEKIVSDYLREHAYIEALGARVVGKTPSSTDAPWIRVTQLDASDDPNAQIERLIAFYFQCDCYAGAEGGQPEANLLARRAREVLKEMERQTLQGAVVSRVSFTGMTRIPDSDVDEPARERFALDAVVRMHG